MKRHLRIPTLLFPALFGVALLAKAADLESDQSPKLDEHSALGLQIQCTPAKTNFVVGESVNLWCVVTNTTDSVKPIAWHPSIGSHFYLAGDEASWMTGLVLPQVLPQLRDSIRIKSLGGSPEYVLFLPPHSSLQLLLTYKPERPGKVKGIIVYDPLMHGGGFFGDEALEKAKRACIFSKTFEYEITAGDKKS